MEILKRAKKWNTEIFQRWKKIHVVPFLGKPIHLFFQAKGLISNLITLFRLSDMEKIFCREKLFCLSDKCITKAGIQN